MVKVAAVGPERSQTWQAAGSYLPQAEIVLYSGINKVIDALAQGETDFAILPIYNTREGGIKDIQALERLRRGYWIDNIVLPIQLSLGSLDRTEPIKILIGTMSILKQCEEFISEKYPDAALLAVHDIKEAIADIRAEKKAGYGIIETSELLKEQSLIIRHLDVAPHNRTRFAILGPEMTIPTGYDATALFTIPLNDRVGLLYDILGEFTRRGINIIDLQSENDIKTQKLKIYIEVEGHRDDSIIEEVLTSLQNHIIQEPHAIKTLGSFPRVDMRRKFIKSFGFIGTGAMGRWFADKLRNEGYQTILCGRSTTKRPAEMIPEVDVVIICVPISATPSTIREYGPLLRPGQALILLVGAAEETIKAALDSTLPEVELMLVHNLWGPKTAVMKDKNAVVVRTSRSGRFCGEFEAFLYKHGADIFQDSPARHDLLMGVSQKLPTAISLAMAMALKDNKIAPDDIASHSTLTSLYGILGMARVHAQNPATYAEILIAGGAGNQMVNSFQQNLMEVMRMAAERDMDKLKATIHDNRAYFSEDFLEDRMEQALAVDQTLGRMLRK
ncbi:prephenate dehydratase domain-containing protein [Desulfobacterota bacterium M19]